MNTFLDFTVNYMFYITITIVTIIIVILWLDGFINGFKVINIELTTEMEKANEYLITHQFLLIKWQRDVFKRKSRDGGPWCPADDFIHSESEDFYSSKTGKKCSFMDKRVAQHLNRIAAATYLDRARKHEIKKLIT